MTGLTATRLLVLGAVGLALLGIVLIVASV